MAMSIQHLHRIPKLVFVYVIVFHGVLACECFSFPRYICSDNSVNFFKLCIFGRQSCQSSYPIIRCVIGLDAREDGVT